MEARKFTIILLPLEEGGYQAFFPHWPNVITWGDTVQETLERAKDGIVTHLEGLADVGLDLNLDLAHVPHVVVGELDVEIPQRLQEIAKTEEEYEKGLVEQSVS
jgi:predicted RNase H-like HicB family nuclease